MIQYIDSIVRIFGYLIGFSGFVLLMYSFGFNFNSVKYKLRSNKETNNKQIILRSNFMRWYDQLLKATINSYKTNHLKPLITLQATILVGLCIIYWLITRSMISSFILPFSVVFLFPITILYIRLLNIRHSTQAVISDTIIQLLQAYTKQHHNILFALKDIYPNLNKQTKFIVGMLIVRLESGISTRKESMQIFSYQIGGEWGRNLSITILKGLEDGTNIAGILEDLSKDITEIDKKIGEVESEGIELIRLGYLPVIVLPLIIVGMHYMVSQMGGNAFEYIFQTATGLKTFTFSVVLTLISFTTSKVFQRPKRGG
ncbi:hypothetical protein LG291_25305 (plasmid) [Cytobacillus firmus]|uniref:hypothetical protein n=2 Tax=Bacillales TaxID=1385 RepID=UPI001A9089F7|nr:hypothetical protein [Bacillus sp. NTK034]MBN8202544.1 hypothetical protein [Bacillus sp. NTK034]